MWAMETLFSALAGLEYWHWLVLGLALLIAELATGSTYLLWPAVGAWITGLLFLLFPIGWPAQLTAFAISTVALTAFARPLVKARLFTQGGDPTLNDPSRQLIGQSATASGAFAQGFGRVKLGDTEWRAQSLDEIAAGEAVEVTGVEGATLRVRRRG